MDDGLPGDSTVDTVWRRTGVLVVGGGRGGWSVGWLVG
jgi:hypothetical protein